MPTDFLLGYASFDAKNKPFIDIESNGVISHVPIFDLNLSLSFDLSTKHCVGWFDYDEMVAKVCPDSAVIEPRYESCLKCHNKTGFNPAFYNAASVSKQQQKINQKPHFLYLAYFSPDVIKVGISQEARGLRRILEQGARQAIKLETFSTALIARQYEAMIVSLPEFIETVSSARKIKLLKSQFNEEMAEQKLTDSKDLIEARLNLKFKEPKLILTSPKYASKDIDLGSAIDMTNSSLVVGRVKSVVGSIIYTEYQSDLLLYELKKLVGYRAVEIKSIPELSLPREQLSFF